MITLTGNEEPVTERRAALDVLFEATPTARSAEVRGLRMPGELRQRFGGDLQIPLHSERPTVVANFVATLDGIVAFGGGELSGGALISGSHEPDRFVMGLLRALADVVVVGAGTLRGSTDHRWIAEYVHPASARGVEVWRTDMGLAPRPTTIIVTGSGDIPIEHGGLTDRTIPVIIATTPVGAERLRGNAVADHVSIEAIGSGPGVSGDDLVALGARLGARLILTEGGPHLLGEVVAADRLDELFLTVAPQLVGRASRERLGLVEGIALPPADARWQDLVSVRRSGDHLFLRYRSTGA
jgi:riboflavin biosynthesis pyrimidine reductase